MSLRSLVRGFIALMLAASPAWAQPAAPVVHIGFSARTMANSNRTDVTAAMKAWILAITKERNLVLQGEPHIFETTLELEQSLREGRIDVFSAPTDEFLLLEKVTTVARMFTSRVGGKITERYLLVVHQDSSAQDLKELRGETLVILENSRTAVASIWLDLELLRRKQPPTTQFFGKTTRVKKPDLAILPVFFKQARAALVTQSMFETATELNPQLAKSLRILATSPELIPTVGAFRASAISGAVEIYRREALRIHETQGGKLVLNLFQTDGVIEIREADLAPTRALFAELERLKAGSRLKGQGP